MATIFPVQHQILIITDSTLVPPIFNQSNCMVWQISKQATPKQGNEEKQVATFSNKNYGIILVACGGMPWPSEIDDFIFFQHSVCKVPLILFPYCNMKYFLLPKVLQFHPLQLGTQSDGGSEVTKTSICFKDVNHPIVQQIGTFACPPAHRVNAEPNKDTQVIAEWADGLPMIAIRGNVVCLNFCLTRYKYDTDATKIIIQTIQYLLNQTIQWREKLYGMYTKRQWTDVQIIV